MARCEDFPCCGHTLEEGCDPLPTGDDMLRDPARYHIGCDHNTGYCEYEEDDDEDMDDDDGLTDAEADAMTLASAGWGTHEDYNYFENEEY